MRYGDLVAEPSIRAVSVHSRREGSRMATLSASSLQSRGAGQLERIISQERQTVVRDYKRPSWTTCFPDERTQSASIQGKPDPDAQDARPPGILGG